MSAAKWRVERSTREEQGYLLWAVVDGDGCWVADFALEEDARACVEAVNGQGWIMTDAPVDQPSERGRRVSDRELEFNIKLCGYDTEKIIPFKGELVLDLRDARATIARLTAENEALRGKIKMAECALHQDDLTVKDLETENEALKAARVVDKSVRLPVGSEPLYVTQEGYDGIREGEEQHCLFFNRLVERLSIPNDLPSLTAVADWIADSLATAKREAWIAGRDAADAVVTQHADDAYTKRESFSQEREAMFWQYYSGASTLLNKTKHDVRALVPPKAEGRNDG